MAMRCVERDRAEPDGWKHRLRDALSAEPSRMLTSALQECAQLQGADGFARDGIQSLRAEAAMFTLAGGATGSLLLSVAADAHRLLSEPATA